MPPEAYMKWHIINNRDYIDGPFETYEEALQEARYLGKETRARAAHNPPQRGFLRLPAAL